MVDTATVRFDIEDIHIVLGPRISHLNSNKDTFSKTADAKYDFNDPFANIVEMHKRIARKQKEEEAKKKEENKELLESKL